MKEKTKILIIGALPDFKRNIFGGATVLMHNFLHFLTGRNLPYTFVRTNPYRNNDGTDKRTLNKIVFILKFFAQLPLHHTIMFNFSDNATVYMYPFLQRIAQLLGKKVVLRKFGGSFNIFLQRVSEKKQQRVRQALEQSDLIFFETKAGIAHLHQFAPATRDKTQWFPNVRYTAPRHKNPTDLNKRIAFFGHISDEKGVGDIIRLAATLPAGYTIELYGGIKEEKYRHFDWEAHSVKYMGEVSSSQVVEILPELLLLLLTSYREGYPGIIIEALSAGLPVVASRVGGIPEIIEDGKNGRLCEAGDIEAFRQAILSFNESNYPQFCQAALQSFNAHFRADIVNEKIYHNIVNLSPHVPNKESLAPHLHHHL